LERIQEKATETTMGIITRVVPLPLVVSFLMGCGESPTNPTGPPPPAAAFEITTLITVFNSADSGAFWSRGTTTTARIGQILLGVDNLAGAAPATNFNNEAGHAALQSALTRMRQQFGPSDYLAAFNDTQANLERYLNDADGDGWAIDGRNGVNTDWPYDGDGNDPDGWTAQLVVNVERVQ
jgi:hypothetical protein